MDRNLLSPLTSSVVVVAVVANVVVKGALEWTPALRQQDTVLHGRLSPHRLQGKVT